MSNESEREALNENVETTTRRRFYFVLVIVVLSYILFLLLSYLVAAGNARRNAVKFADTMERTLLEGVKERPETEITRFVELVAKQADRDAGCTVLLMKGNEQTGFVRLVPKRLDISNQINLDEIDKDPDVFTDVFTDNIGAEYKLVVAARPASVFSRAGGSLYLWWLMGLVYAAASIAAAWLFVRRYMLPVSKTVDSLTMLAGGQVHVPVVPAEGFNDANILAETVNALIAYRRRILETSWHLAEGNLAWLKDKQGVRGELGEAIRQMALGIKTLVDEIRSVGTQVASSSAEIQAVSENMEHGIQRQAQQSNHVARSAEDIATSVIEIAQNSRNVLQNSREAMTSSEAAMGAAQEGGKVVQKTVKRMGELVDSVLRTSESIEALGKRSQDIGQIIETIDDIAEMTKLLALNAAIEAARAGEHGKGFGVVADEIRRLADQTDEATQRVSMLIESIQDHTRGVVEQMTDWSREVVDTTNLSNSAGEALDDIIKRNEQVQDMVHQIVAATEQQTSASEEMSKNVESISRAIDAISVVANESSTGAGEVRNSANELASLTEKLVRVIEKFKTD